MIYDLSAATGGFLVMVFCFSFLSRWLRLLLLFLGKYPTAKGQAAERPSRWLFPFLIVNPAPWIFLGLPFFVHHILAQPRSPRWLWAFGGASLAPLLIAVMTVRVVRIQKTRRRLAQPSRTETRADPS